MGKVDKLYEPQRSCVIFSYLYVSGKDDDRERSRKTWIGILWGTLIGIQLTALMKITLPPELLALFYVIPIAGVAHAYFRYFFRRGHSYIAAKDGHQLDLRVNDKHNALLLNLYENQVPFHTGVFKKHFTCRQVKNEDGEIRFHITGDPSDVMAEYCKEMVHDYSEAVVWKCRKIKIVLIPDDETDPNLIKALYAWSEKEEVNIL